MTETIVGRDRGRVSDAEATPGAPVPSSPARTLTIVLPA